MGENPGVPQALLLLISSFLPIAVYCLRSLHPHANPSGNYPGIHFNISSECLGLVVLYLTYQEDSEVLCF